MENRNNILNELREISPVVADIGHQVPYTVPAGYFEGLADRLLLLVKADQANTPVLPKTDHPYQVPQGYFEGLANTILQRVKADDNVTLSPALQQANNNIVISRVNCLDLPLLTLMLLTNYSRISIRSTNTK
jgi:hypothetical protein